MPAPSKIARLPEEFRAWIHRLFVDHAYGDLDEVTTKINDQLRAEGIPMSIGRSAIAAESQRVRRAQEAIKATTEAARLIAESAPDQADHRSAAAMALVTSEVFELLLQVRESETVEDPAERLGLMNEAALGLSRLSRARVNQARWAEEVEARAKAAAEKVERLARGGGLSADTVAEIRASILGISTRAAA